MCLRRSRKIEKLKLNCVASVFSWIVIEKLSGKKLLTCRNGDSLLVKETHFTMKFVSIIFKGITQTGNGLIARCYHFPMR